MGKSLHVVAGMDLADFVAVEAFVSLKILNAKCGLIKMKRLGGGFRGPRRGSSGFRGGLPFRFLRGDFRPPRGGPARISRDFSSPRFSAPRGGRGGPPPLLIPRRNEPPRSAWIRGVPPISARGASSAPRMFTNPLRQSYGGSGGRSGYGNPPMGNPRQLQVCFLNFISLNGFMYMFSF